jgi:hypothetical protein
MFGEVHLCLVYGWDGSLHTLAQMAHTLERYIGEIPLRMAWLHREKVA